MSGILCLKWNNHTSTFIQTLDTLRSKELYCDATLACCGKYYPVHRFVLTTCSEYFEEIFERAPCKHPFIILKDVDNSQLEALLNYMYKGEVNVLQEYLPGLIRAAEALKVKGLAVSEDNYEIKKEKERKYQPCSSSKKVESQENKNNSSLAEGEEASDSDKGMEEVDLMNKHVNSSLNFGSTSVEEMRPLSSHSNNLDECSADLSEVVEGECILEEDNEFSVSNIKCEPEDDEGPVDEKFQAAKSMSEKNAEMLVSLLSPNMYPEKESQEESDSVNGFSLPQCSTWNDNLSNSDPLSKEILQASWLQSSDYDAFPIDPLHYLSMNGSASPNYSSSVDENSITFKEGKEKKDKFSPSGKGASKYQCHDCQFKTNDKAAYRLHMMRKHTGEKPFACTICPYRCTTKDMLKIHTRKHTGERPFSCPYCSCRMAVKSSLKRHILLKHIQTRKPKSDTEPVIGPLKTYKCPHCSYESQMKSNLKLHCMRIHTGEKPVACSLCPYRTTTKPQLEKHMRKHTGEKPFACTFCSYKAAQKHSLLRHMSLHTK